MFVCDVGADEGSVVRFEFQAAIKLFRRLPATRAMAPKLEGAQGGDIALI